MVYILLIKRPNVGLKSTYDFRPDQWYDHVAAAFGIRHVRYVTQMNVDLHSDVQLCRHARFLYTNANT